MHLIGLTDDHRPTEADGSDWPCPISVEELELFAAASSHQFVRQLVQEGKADGYVHTDKLDDLMDAFGSGKWQKLCHKTTSELYLEDCFPSLYAAVFLSPPALNPLAENRSDSCYPSWYVQ